MRKISFLSVLVLTFLLQNLSVADINDGLVAYYPFDGNANDMSGNGNHGIENGGLTYVTGKSGQAASFDGVDDYIEISNSSSLELNRKVSLSYWIIPQQQSGNAFPIICKNRHTGNNYSSWIYKNLDTVSFQQYPSSSQSDVIYTFKANYDFIPGEYIHIVTVRNDSNIKIYVNNELVLEEGADYDANMKRDSLFIGYDGGYGYSTYKGLIDEIRIYNRALSESEIQELYTGSRNSSSNCRATFQDGVLNIPCVDVILTDPLGGGTTSVSYSADMQLQDNSSPLTFELIRAEQQ